MYIIYNLINIIMLHVEHYNKKVYYDGNEFNGKLIYKGKYLNGKRENEKNKFEYSYVEDITLKNGIKDGEVKQYDNEGKLKFEAEYVNGSFKVKKNDILNEM